MVEQGSTPSNPSAGKQKLYVRSSDHVLCLVDSSGTVTAFGAPALTNPMTTSQDIIVGGSSGTPTRLAKGSAGSFLGLSNGSLAYLAGSSFPGSPATNDLYYRTDRAKLYYYDGTRWLTVEEYPLTLNIIDALEGTTTAPSIYAVVDEGENGAYVTRL